MSVRVLFGVPVVALLLVSCATTVPTGGTAASEKIVGDDPLLLVAEAHSRLEAGEIADGLQLFRRAVALDPESAELAEEYGLALADVGLPDQAILQLQRAKVLTPAGEATLGILLSQSAKERAQLEQAVVHLKKGVSAAAQGMGARVALAQSLLKLDRAGEAWETIKSMLDEHPDDARLQLMAGEALREMGKLEESAAVLRKASGDTEARQRATLELVQTLAAAGKYKEAADTMGAFLQEAGATLNGLSRWATLLARAGEREKAKSVLDDVLAKDAKFRDAILLKAMLEGADGNTAAAEQLYQRALGLDPTDLDARVGLARLYMDARRFDQARTSLDQILQQLDQAKPRDPDAVLEVTQDRASVELLDHRADVAKPWLDRLGPRPADRRTLALWAEYYRLRDAYREGLDWVQKVNVADDAATKRLRSALLAEFRFAAGDEKQAEETLKPLLAGTQDDVTTAIGVLDRRKRFAEAAGAAHEAAARFPESKEIEFTYAASLERAGQWEKSAQAFRALIKKDPENAAALNYLGYMLADKGVQLEEARDLVTRAVKLEPTSGAYLDSLGWVYFRLGKLDEARQNLTEAARLEPFDATVHEHLGDLYRALGSRDKAEDAYRRALAFKPEETGQKERIEGKLAALVANARP